MHPLGQHEGSCLVPLRRHLLAAVAKLPERERVLLTRYAKYIP